MQDVIAQVQQLDDLDPAMRQQLLEDLRQTDPRLWQGVISQFRATLAYRRQLQERQLQQAGNSASQQASSGNPSSLRAQPSAMNVQPASASDPTRPRPLAPSGQPSAPAPATAGPLHTPGNFAAAVGSQIPPSQASDQAFQGPGASAQRIDRNVIQTSYEAPTTNASREELEQAIRGLEASVSNSPQSAHEVAQHARLRMLYLLAGRRNEAFRPIPSASPSMQDFWSKELYGLATFLDTQQIDNPDRRAAETRQHLSEALDSLSHSCALVVRNLAFVTNVDDYGVYRPFPEYKFVPGQEVIVYAEIDNFQNEATPTGYATSIRYSCQIFDSRNQRVDEHEFKSDEVCRNPRRDYFLGARIYMPDRIYNGRHTLLLTVEDLKSQKIGQQSIEFTIGDAKK